MSRFSSFAARYPAGDGRFWPEDATYRSRPRSLVPTAVPPKRVMSTCRPGNLFGTVLLILTTTTFEQGIHPATDPKRTSAGIENGRLDLSRERSGNADHIRRIIR